MLLMLMLINSDMNEEIWTGGKPHAAKGVNPKTTNMA
jgi:hypothetical protein